MLVATAIGIQAKDLNKEQMAIRLDVVKYLSKEGFQPKIDTDGDVKFVILLSMRTGTSHI